MRRHKQTGFTLLELMIILVITALLAVMALPSYIERTREARRIECQTVLASAADMLRRYHAEHKKYDGITGLPEHCPNNTDPDDAYIYAVAPNFSGDRFTLIATPGASQAEDLCGTLTLNSDGVKSASGTARDCWQR